MVEETSKDLTSRIASLPIELRERAVNTAIVVAWEKLPLSFVHKDFLIELERVPYLDQRGWICVLIDKVSSPPQYKIELDSDKLYQWNTLSIEAVNEPELSLKEAIIRVLLSTNGY